MQLNRSSLLLMLGGLLLVPMMALGQKKKQPTIMVMPADQWCVEQGYYSTYEDPQSGETKKVMEYKEAFQEDEEIGLVISKIGEMFGERGFPLRDMKQKMKQIDQDQALDQAEGGGRGTKKTLKQKILTQAKADIIIYMNWDLKKDGPYKQITFQMDAVDPYIAENVGNASGTGPKNTGNINKLLEESVLEHVTNLQSQMQDYFDDLNKNGRKIRMRLKVASGSQYNLTDYCSSKEKFAFGQIFEDAVTFEAVNKVYRIGSKTNTQIAFDMIRIPMFYKRETAFGTSEVAMNASDFAKKVSEKVVNNCKRLTMDQIDITGIGLGEASITITPK